MSAVIQPFAYFTGLDGLALDNGSIYIGDAGQDARANPIAAYRDEALTIPWAQPIRTVAGYPSYQGAPSQIYIADGACSVTILDNDGSIVLNNAVGVASISAEALEGSGGSALIGFIQAGTGAVATTVQARLRETISVKDYGAVGNGVTNDTAAFQAAVDRAAALSGAKVTIPAGTYLLNGTVNITTSGVTIEGDGHQSTWIVNGQTNAPAIKFGDGVSTYNRCGISNVVFGQKSGVTAVSGNCGLLASKCSNFVMDNVQVFQFPQALYDGVIFDYVTQSYVTNIGLQGCTNAAWLMRNNTFGIFATNGRCDSSAYGMHIRDCQGLYITNFDNFGNTINAYNIGNTGAGDTRYMFFTNCIGDTSGQTNWVVTELEVGRFTNCWAATQTNTTSYPNSDGWYLSGAAVVDIGFSNCVAISNCRHGINLDYAVKVSINGCALGSNFDPTAFGGLGPGNGIGAGGGSGVSVGASSSRIRINGGVFDNNQRYGAEVASGAQKVDITAVEMRDNILGRILNNANASAGECKISNVGGYNPVGFITAPAIPASGSTATNLSGVDVMVYLAGGTLTGNVEINGHGVLAVTNTGYYLPAGATIKLTYSVAPTWAWSGF